MSVVDRLSTSFPRLYNSRLLCCLIAPVGEGVKRIDSDTLLTILRKEDFLSIN